MHRRGYNDRNLIAIEIKKAKLCPFDLAKLQGLTKLKEEEGRYEYKLGVFLHFVKGHQMFLWFVAGKQYH